jgi:UTP:GlnB (protein PII) uridylyltransferase
MMVHTIKDIVASKEFETAENEYMQIAFKRVLQADDLVVQTSNKYLDPVNLAVIARGSYGYADLSLHSDLDILVLSSSRDSLSQSNIWVKNLRTPRIPSIRTRVLQEIPGPQFWPACFWLNLNAVRLVWGSQLLYKQFKNQITVGLESLKADTILELWADDPERCTKDADISEPHYFSIKRGRGGTVDAEFMSLIRIWSGSRIHLPNGLVEDFRTSSLAYRYLRVLKEFLHRFADGPLESYQNIFQGESAIFSTNVFTLDDIEAVRTEHCLAIKRTQEFMRSHIL